MSAHRAGRHRLGNPGLRYCREFPGVRERLEYTERVRRQWLARGFFERLRLRRRSLTPVGIAGR